MVKIFLDLEKLKNPNSGLGQFCLHLSSAIASQIPTNDLGVYIPQEYAYLFPDLEVVLWKRYHKLFKIKLKTKIWHSLHQEAVYFPQDKKVKKILTIHDLNFLEIYKGQKRDRHLARLQELVNKALAITFISEYTKTVAEDNLVFKHGVVKKVIYNGVAINKLLKANKPTFINSVAPFLFTIGIVGEKKNFHTLVEMMRFLPALKLYISGNKNGAYATKIEQLVRKYKLEQQVFLTGEISEAEKIWMYKNCSAFVFPSTNEGFGLPVVEAMSFGKPLILSNKTSLPEIGGELASYFSSFNSEDMANEVFKAINLHTKSRAEQLVLRSGKFSWNNAAKQYVALYRKILEA